MSGSTWNFEMAVWIGSNAGVGFCSQLCESSIFYVFSLILWYIILTTFVVEELKLLEISNAIRWLFLIILNRVQKITKIQLLKPCNSINWVPKFGRCVELVPQTKVSKRCSNPRKKPHSLQNVSYIFYKNTFIYARVNVHTIFSIYFHSGSIVTVITTASAKHTDYFFTLGIKIIIIISLDPHVSTDCTQKETIACVVHLSPGNLQYLKVN